MGSGPAPLELDIRANLAGGRVYLEGLEGPWLMFGQSSVLTFGLEVGYLDPGPIAPCGSASGSSSTPWRRGASGHFPGT